MCTLRFAALLACAPLLFAQTPDLVKTGESLFSQQCGFCHGRDTGGGEDGPDLTRSKIVAEDVNGSLIGPIVRNGKEKMPRFTVSDSELAALVAFIHARKTIAESQKGGRKGVDPADLSTGSIAKGKAYFNGAGKCNTCHSPTGDLAGAAARNTGLKLFQRLMYPSGAKAKIAVTLPSGETVTGTRAYYDEFTVALRDSAGRYRSWPASKVKVKVDDPAEAHVDLLAKYTDDDIHNLMTYLLTLK
jgi:cytochrome c oxidase cbb3-type subunit III